MTSPTTEATTPPPHTSRSVVWLTIGMMAIVAVIAFFSMRVVHHIRQYRDFISVVEAGYRSLEAKYDFAAPAEGSAPEMQRVNEYLEARRELIGEPPAEVEATAQRFLAGDWMPEKNDLLPLAGDALEYMEASVVRHQNALRAAGMSPSEYYWLHGYVVNGLMSSEENPAAREKLETMLARIETNGQAETLQTPQDSTAGGEPAGAVQSAEQIKRRLREKYDAWPMPRRETLRSFEAPGALAALLDVIVAQPELLEMLGIETQDEESLVSSAGEEV